MALHDGCGVDAKVLQVIGSDAVVFMQDLVEASRVSHDNDLGPFGGAHNQPRERREKIGMGACFG